MIKQKSDDYLKESETKPQETSASNSSNIQQEEDDMQDQFETKTIKKRVESRFNKRRGLIHQSSLQPSYSKLQSEISQDDYSEHSNIQHNSDSFYGKEQIDNIQGKSKFKESRTSVDEDNDGDIIMNEDELAAIINQDVGQEMTELLTEEQKQQILKVKELRNQKRKLDGNDYVPFDESTSGGVFARDQIHSINNRMDNLEAHIIQRQIIKEQYSINRNKMQDAFDMSRQKFIRPSNGIIDLDHGMFDDELISNASEEEKDELEKLIKRTVKSGSGRDYDSIIKKDVMAYNKNKGDSDYNEINKFEQSRNYQQIIAFMDQNEDSYMNDIEAEINKLSQQTKEFEQQMRDTKNELKLSEFEIQDSDSRFNEVGDNFILAKDICEVLEDLKEMLMEKESDIKDALKYRLDIEKSSYDKIASEFVCHIADLYQEMGVKNIPLYVTKHFKREVHEDMMNDLQSKDLRSLQRQSCISGIIWEVIITKQNSETVKQMNKLGKEANEQIIGDIIESYQNLEASLYPSITKLIKMGVKVNLLDLIDYIKPYFTLEILKYNTRIFTEKNLHQQLINSKQLDEFLIENSGEYTNASIKFFKSKLALELYQNMLLSFINYVWNPFDEEHTKRFLEFLDSYVDVIYIPDEQSLEPLHGLLQVKEILNTLLKRYNDCIDLLQINKNNASLSEIINGIEAIIKSILCCKNQVPKSNINALVYGQIFNESVFKVCDKLFSNSPQVINGILNRLITRELIDYSQELETEEEVQDKDYLLFKESLQMLKHNDQLLPTPI
ncbi:UNKNOWN [Stylonychia lemnae]|uniref:Uncharacterized protein n=1 Tax=Stylonychia lemnae TaxID=5949 RepID=A0A078APT3_STYLE|nr:UNKNOWN [Stylonychia lemnae]|eukprot:CDW84174.1 UNKNOWN [Stylonychia lemnae]